MNIVFLYPILIFVAGAMTALQPLINAKLSPHVGSPLWASFVSFAVGTILLLIVGVVMNGRFMVIEPSGLKWWMFSGGVLGAIFVTLTVYAVPHLGVAVLVALMIAGQLVFSAILDHYGVLSPAPNPITWQKLVGLTLLGLGAFITLKA